MQGSVRMTSTSKALDSTGRLVRRAWAAGRRLEPQSVLACQSLREAGAAVPVRLAVDLHLEVEGDLGASISFISFWFIWARRLPLVVSTIYSKSADSGAHQ